MTGQKPLTVNQLIDQILAARRGDQEVMLYRYRDGTWSADIGKPHPYVLLGEVAGEYHATGRTMKKALRALLDQVEPPSQWGGRFAGRQYE